MGIDAGFDMAPILSREAADASRWNQFIDHIKEAYKDDKQIEILPHYINFNAGEHPMLPFQGHKFRRFSSKISGVIARTTGVETYIFSVARVAKLYFGSRIKFWHEGADEYGVYDWAEVHDSIRSYVQPDEIEMPRIISNSDLSTNAIDQLESPLFEVKTVPGKGRAVVARADIAPGTRILCEKPLLTAGPESFEKLEGLLVAELKSMPKSSQRQFFALHNNHKGKMPLFSGIFKTNALPCGSGSSIGGVYPTICFINHSCVPNAHNSWNSDEKHETIHAIRAIESGCEITIPYDHGGTSHVRRSFLKESFGFWCDCNYCSGPLGELKASNERRSRIQNLDNAIGDPFRIMRSPKESLRDCHILLEVLKQEFDSSGTALLARLYYDAFQIAIAHGDQARASVFARRAYEVRVICEGDDSPETRKVKSLAVKPADHPTFRAYSAKWRTQVDSVPDGLNSDNFNKWLFKLEG